MLIKKPADIKPSEITSEQHYLNRRQFIQATGLLGLGGVASLPWIKHSWAETGRGPLGPERFQKLPRGAHSTSEELTDFDDATSYCNFYEFGTAKEDPMVHSGSLVTHPWQVVVAGECDRPGNYTLEDFLKPHALEERIYRLRCVEAWSMVIPWVGFSLGEALKRFQPNSQARYVAFTTLHDPEQMPGQRRPVLQWPYREGLRMDEAMNPLATLAVGMYGRVLPNQNGAPLRLVVPWKYGFKSIKSIVKIEFTREQPESSWNMAIPNEYGFYSNVNPAVDHRRWSQKRERRIGEWSKRKTLPFNGYGEQVAHLYKEMDLKEYF